MGIEDFCYVGDCGVCGESVDENEAGHCQGCKQVFHWSRCGGWHNSAHVCNRCQEGDKLEQVEYNELDYWGWECPDKECGHWNETQDDPAYQDSVTCDGCGKEYEPVAG